MTEEEFVRQIDCQFPYQDERAGLALVEEASKVSPNACFMIGEELCRPPHDAAPDVDSRLRVLARLRQAFDHPLREPVLEVVELRIRGGDLPVRDALTLLRRIGAYPGQYCAMNIVYFACDQDSSGELDEECDEIRECWSAA